MQITYKRNGLKNYMVIKNERGGTAGLREKMIVRNKIRCLAKMTPQSIDGSSYYYYDIQGKVSMEALFTGRTLSKNELVSILQNLSGMLLELQRYMLSPDEVIFTPKDIWLSPDTLEPSFIYVPDMTPDDSMNIKALAEFLTEHVDGNDRDAATMAYEYLEMVENGYMIPDITRQSEDISRDMEAPDTPPIDPDDYWDLKEGISDEMKPFFEDTGSDKKTDTKARVRTAYICLGLVIAAAGVYIAFVLNPALFPIVLTDEEYIIAGACIAIAFAMVLTGVMYMFNKKTAKAEEPLPETPQSTYDTISKPGFVGYDAAVQEKYGFEEYRADDEGGEKTVLLKRPRFMNVGNKYPTLRYDDGRHITIRKFPFIMGKMKARVDEIIDGEGVSRIHAMIKEQDDRYYISDLNSLNGTGVNGKMLEANETVEISDGDIISLADTMLTFQAGAIIPSAASSGTI